MYADGDQRRDWHRDGNEGRARARDSDGDRDGDRNRDGVPANCSRGGMGGWSPVSGTPFNTVRNAGPFLSPPKNHQTVVVLVFKGTEAPVA